MNRQTWVDDGELRIFRHAPEPVRSFEAVVDIPGRAAGLHLSTPDGSHEIDIELRAYRQGAMAPVLKVHGQPALDGRLWVTVTNLLTRDSLLIAVPDAETPAALE